jgi:hypothetical protein
LFFNARDETLTEYCKFSGLMWELGNNFVRTTLGSRKTSGAGAITAKALD